MLTTAPCKHRDLLPLIIQLLALLACLPRIHKKRKKKETKRKKKGKGTAYIKFKRPLPGTIAGAKGCSHPKRLCALGLTGQRKNKPIKCTCLWFDAVDYLPEGHGVSVVQNPGTSWCWSPGWGKPSAASFVLLPQPLCCSNRNKTAQPKYYFKNKDS